MDTIRERSVFAAQADQYEECGEAAVSRILHFTVTPQPSADWVARYAILDRDPIFDANVLKASGLTPKRTSVQAPWQNGMAERWIGSWPPRDPGSRHRAE